MEIRSRSKTQPAAWWALPAWAQFNDHFRLNEICSNYISFQSRQETYKDKPVMLTLLYEGSRTASQIQGEG